MLLAQIEILTKRAPKSEEAKRLMSIPSGGSVCAMALLSITPPTEKFRRERDLLT